MNIDELDEIDDIALTLEAFDNCLDVFSQTKNIIKTGKQLTSTEHKLFNNKISTMLHRTNIGSEITLAGESYTYATFSQRAELTIELATEAFTDKLLDIINKFVNWLNSFKEKALQTMKVFQQTSAELVGQIKNVVAKGYVQPNENSLTDNEKEVVAKWLKHSSHSNYDNVNKASDAVNNFISKIDTSTVHNGLSSFSSSFNDLVNKWKSLSTETDSNAIKQKHELIKKTAESMRSSTKTTLSLGNIFVKPTSPMEINNCSSKSSLDGSNARDCKRTPFLPKGYVWFTWKSIDTIVEGVEGENYNMIQGIEPASENKPVFALSMLPASELDKNKLGEIFTEAFLDKLSGSLNNIVEAIANSSSVSANIVELKNVIDKVKTNKSANNQKTNDANGKQMVDKRLNRSMDSSRDLMKIAKQVLTMFSVLKGVLNSVTNYIKNYLKFILLSIELVTREPQETTDTKSENQKYTA